MSSVTLVQQSVSRVTCWAAGSVISLVTTTTTSQLCSPHPPTTLYPLEVELIFDPLHLLDVMGYPKNWYLNYLMGFVDMRERYIIMHEGSLLVLNSFIVFITRSEMHVCCFIAASQSLSSWCRFIVKTRQGVEWWLFVDLRIVHRMSSVTEQLRYQLPNKLNTQTDYLRGGCTSLDPGALLLLVLHLILDYWAREEKIVGGHIWWYVQIFMIGRLEVSADWSTI